MMKKLINVVLCVLVTSCFMSIAEALEDYKVPFNLPYQSFPIPQPIPSQGWYSVTIYPDPGSNCNATNITLSNGVIPCRLVNGMCSFNVFASSTPVTYVGIQIFSGACSGTVSVGYQS